VCSGGLPIELRAVDALPCGLGSGEANRQSRDDRRTGVTLGRCAKAGSLGRTTAGARWVDGSQLGPDGLDELTVTGLSHG
jgi:hypothetical protein